MAGIAVLPEIDDPGIKAATYGTLITFLIGVAWKLRLWMRGDARTDGAAERDAAAEKRAQDVWMHTVERLEATIKRMDEELKALSTRLNTEVQMRYAAEGGLRRAEYRIAELESALAALRNPEVPAILRKRDDK